MTGKNKGHNACKIKVIVSLLDFEGLSCHKPINPGIVEQQIFLCQSMLVSLNEKYLYQSFTRLKTLNMTCLNKYPVSKFTANIKTSPNEKQK